MGDRRSDEKNDHFEGPTQTLVKLECLISTGMVRGSYGINGSLVWWYWKAETIRIAIAGDGQYAVIDAQRM